MALERLNVAGLWMSSSVDLAKRNLKIEGDGN